MTPNAWLDTIKIIYISNIYIISISMKSWSFDEKRWYETIYNNFNEWEAISDDVDEIIFKAKNGKEYLAVVDYASDEEAFILCELEKLPEGWRKMSELADGEEIDLIAYCTHGHARWYRGDSYSDSWITPESAIDEMEIWWLAGSWMMPNTKPALNTFSKFDNYFKKVIKAEQKQEPEVRTFNMWHFCITDWKDAKGNRKNNIEECKKWLEHERCMWIKIYPASEKSWSVTTGFWWTGTHQQWIEDGSTTDLAAQACLEVDKTLTIHCETPWKSQETGEAERDYIKNTVLPLAKKYPNLKLVIAHVTLKSTVLDVIKANAMYGSNIHMEFTADHLFSNKDDIKNIGKRMDALDPSLQWKWEWVAQCFPQVRWDENHLLKDASAWDDNRDFLWRCMKMATRTPYLKIMLWTDHAPHPQANKLKENPSRWISSYRDCMRIYAEIAKQNWITVEQFKEFCSWTAIGLHYELTKQDFDGNLRVMTLVHKEKQKMNPQVKFMKEMDLTTSVSYIWNQLLKFYHDTDFELLNWYGSKKKYKLYQAIKEFWVHIYWFNNTDKSIKKIDTYENWNILNKSYSELELIRKTDTLKEIVKLLNPDYHNKEFRERFLENELFAYNLDKVKQYLHLTEELNHKLQKENTLWSHHYDWNVLSPYDWEYVDFIVKKSA